jgi:hypothetical protein
MVKVLEGLLLLLAVPRYAKAGEECRRDSGSDCCAFWLWHAGVELVWWHGVLVSQQLVSVHSPVCASAYQGACPPAC